MRIAIDAMGGDNAPQSNVEGALMAAREWNDIEIILVGDEARILPLLQDKPSNIHIHHTNEVILADDEPVKAVRRKKDASMVVAGRLVKDREADAMISSGNTGALMATGLLIIGRIEGIERPALAPMLPSSDGRGVLALDLGANMDAEPQHLVQYAIMGRIYRELVHGMTNPRIALLNVGTEEMKGNELTKAVFPFLQQAPIHFIGNVEARDVLEGNCDVLVCDAFVGNILLKAFEGASSTIFTAIKSEFSRSFLTKIAAAIVGPGLRKFKKKMDYREHGGALLLGVNGICIKSHGSSDATAIKSSVRQARDALKVGDLVGAISAEINRK
ncbi:MAG: phosphate acyltransferase PlsX [Paenibacillaceae bacterium]